MIDLVIFDFDGVVVDSELVSNGVLAETATELGHAMTSAEAVAYFGGSTLAQQVEKLEVLTGRILPGTFGDQLHQRTLQALASVRAIAGLNDFLDWLGDTPVCIGSTSAPDRIAVCLDAVGLRDRFEGHVFSVSMVRRNKPFPDIFLHAAQSLGARPHRTLVIEDSVHGVKAGVAANMHVIGLHAASHLQANHAERLRDAGAHRVAQDYDAVRSHVLAFRTAPEVPNS